MGAVEVELKFQVGAAVRAGVRAAMAGAVPLRLRAAYADTADDRLARAGFALRRRQEGRRWVQTLKGRGDGLMQRLEHEVMLPPLRGVPALDPARHAGTPAGDALAALLADGAPLVERYRTDIRRLVRRVRSAGATIEIAFDEGRIEAGGRRVPVCELEFELVAGPPQALLALAARWVRRHGLWLDVQTKSERGLRLALGAAGAPPQKAAPVALPPGTAPSAALAAMLQSALSHALPNAAEIGAGRGTPEHLHQLRVGLRRLRTALHLFGPWSSDPPAAQALEARWRASFARLGAARDADVLAALPALAGLPARRASAPADDPAAVVRSAEFSACALQTFALALAAPPALEPALDAAAPAVLKAAWKRALADAAAFAGADPARQHRTRKRLKRVRYAAEFLLSRLPAKPARRALQALRDALDALGAHHDVVVAEAVCRSLDGRDPAVAWALGWLAAERAHREARALEGLQRLAEVPRFW